MDCVTIVPKTQNREKMENEVLKKLEEEFRVTGVIALWRRGRGSFDRKADSLLSPIIPKSPRLLSVFKTVSLQSLWAGFIYLAVAQ